MEDFSGSWHDGIALCALLESICPGVCPSYHLLSGVNRVKNCRLGLKLANKYLYVPMVSWRGDFMSSGTFEEDNCCLCQFAQITFHVL